MYFGQYSPAVICNSECFGLLEKIKWNIIFCDLSERKVCWRFDEAQWWCMLSSFISRPYWVCHCCCVLTSRIESSALRQVSQHFNTRYICNCGFVNQGNWQGLCGTKSVDASLCTWACCPNFSTKSWIWEYHSRAVFP